MEGREKREEVSESYASSQTRNDPPSHLGKHQRKHLAEPVRHPKAAGAREAKKRVRKEAEMTRGRKERTNQRIE